MDHQRSVVRYFGDLSVTTLEQMQAWARTSTFSEFEGRVKGPGRAVCHWLAMRLGVETVKPNVHTLRFVTQAVGRPVRSGRGERIGARGDAAGHPCQRPRLEHLGPPRESS